MGLVFDQARVQTRDAFAQLRDFGHPHGQSFLGGGIGRPFLVQCGLGALELGTQCGRFLPGALQGLVELLQLRVEAIPGLGDGRLGLLVQQRRRRARKMFLHGRDLGRFWLLFTRIPADPPNEFHVLELSGQSIGYLDRELELIALDPDDPFFPCAWRHILYSGDDDRVLGLLQCWQPSSWEPVFEQMFAALLDRCDDMPKAWHFLLEQASAPSVRSQWIERMAGAANSYLNEIRDAARFLSGEHLTEFLNKLPIDTMLLELVKVMLQLPRSEELETKVAELFSGIFRRQGPVMHATCSRVQRLLIHSGQSESELYQVVEAYRTRLIGEIQHRREDHDVALEGWTFGYP
ncbi:MAG: hypothetical protein ACRER3_04865 [Pseudomonas fluorescens]